LWRVRRLQLCGEHIGLVSIGGHVDGTLVDALLLLSFLDHQCLAVDEWYDGELLFGDRLLHLAGVLVPGGTLKLETEDVCAVIEPLEHLGNLGFPMELLLDVCLDVELVETLASFLGADLLNCGQEGVRLVESVEETDGLVDHGRFFLPHVEELEALLHIVEPRVEASGSHP